jgi:hypothetical protein
MDDEDATVREPNSKRQQERFDRFRLIYNEERPHESLSYKTPASVYVPSTRHYPTKLREPEYSEEFLVVRATKDARISWNGKTVQITRKLAGEPVALLEREDGCIELHYGPVVFGHLNRRGRFRRGKPAGPKTASKTRAAAVLQAFSGPEHDAETLGFADAGIIR